MTIGIQISMFIYKPRELLVSLYPSICKSCHVRPSWPQTTIPNPEALSKEYECPNKFNNIK